MIKCHAHNCGNVLGSLVPEVTLRAVYAYATSTGFSLINPTS